MHFAKKQERFECSKTSIRAKIMNRKWGFEPILGNEKIHLAKLWQTQNAAFCKKQGAKSCWTTRQMFAKKAKTYVFSALFFL